MLILVSACSMGRTVTSCTKGKDPKECLSKLAQKNNAQAQLKLGDMYYDGYDYKQAVYWYKKSANAGNAEGQEKLGNMYDKGYGISEDYRIAAQWWEKSADQGYAPAQFDLGMLHDILREYPLAIQFYEKASKQHYGKATCRLGVLYFKGIFVERDDRKAIKYFLKSAEEGYYESQAIMAGYYIYGYENIVKIDYKKGFDLSMALAKHKKGRADAIDNLTYIYGIQKQNLKSYAWYLVSRKCPEDPEKLNVPHYIENLKATLSTDKKQQALVLCKKYQEQIKPAD